MLKRKFKTSPSFTVYSLPSNLILPLFFEFTQPLLFVALFSFSANSNAKSITLGWAAWDPANALQELTKEFTAESGIEVNFEFVPWPNFADRMLNELNNKGKTFDLLIGDSQWIGSGAVYGHYVKLNDFFDKEGISMDDFSPATVYAY